MAELSLREAVRDRHLGYLDALLDKKDAIARLSLEDLSKVAALGRAAYNECCNGSAGMGLEQQVARPI